LVKTLDLDDFSADFCRHIRHDVVVEHVRFSGDSSDTEKPFVSTCETWVMMPAPFSGAK
jgi:hypothetical protein